MNRSDRLREANARVARRLLISVVAMFGFGYALVPLYNMLCEVTGLNGKTGVVSAQDVGSDVDIARTVTVEFLGTASSDLPWEFRPVVARVRVHPGELREIRYFAANLSDTVLVGQAVPSVTPSKAARYLSKTECFCFTRQRFEPGEGREMPVKFVVDANLPDNISTLTLSYTFFRVDDKG